MSSTLTDLPYDCINEILEYVHQYRQVCRVACTCWYLQEQAQEEILWEQLCRVHLPHDVYQKAKKGVATHTFHTFVSWQRLLRQHSRNKKMDTLVAFITQGDPSATSAKTDDLMRKLIDVSFRDGGCIGTDGATNLARVMDRNANVESLDVSSQLIRDAGFAALVSTLPTCSSLSVLSLAENRLSAKSHGALTVLIATMAPLRTLDLSQNAGLSISVIASALNDRKANGFEPLQKLYLDGIPSCSSEKDVKGLLSAFLDTAKQNQSFRALTMRSSSLENGSIKHVSELVKNWNEKCGCAQRVVDKGDQTTGRPPKTEKAPTLLLDVSELPYSADKTHNKLPGKGEQVDALSSANAGGAVKLVYNAKDGVGGCSCM